MTTPIANTPVYGDFAGLESLKRSVHGDNPAAIREVARQFESLFARMLIKSMRDAIGPDPIFGSDQEQTYQGMFDDQLSLELTRGHGLGLADMLVRQLQGKGLIGAHGAAGGTSSAAGSAAASAAGSTGSAASMQSAAPTTASSVSSAASAASAPTTPTPPPRHAISFTPATHSTPSTGSKVSRAEQQSFIRDLWPQARQAAEQLGVSPQSLVAQAALETDWGRSVPQDAAGRSSNNLFGVKAADGWAGPSVSAGTREFSGGSARATTAEFRAYGSRAQGFQDYVAMLKSNPRYAAALNTGTNVQAFASALQRGGYATDPEYALKVSAVASDVASASGESLKLASAAPITAGADSLL